MPNFVENAIVTPIEAIKEGWSLLKGFKFRFFILFISQQLFLGVSVATYFIMILAPQLSSAMSQDETLKNVSISIQTIPFSTLLSFALISIVLNCFIFFFTAMLQMLAIRRVRGLPSKISLVFQECKHPWFKIIALSVLLSLLNQFVLLLDGLLTDWETIKTIVHLGSFYIDIALTFFSLPLIVIKPEISLLTAIKNGIQTVNSKWLTLAFYFLLVMVIGIIGILSLLIAFIWLIPLIYLAYGVIIRDAYQLPKTQSA